MRKRFRVLLLTSLFAAVLYADKITIPLDDGSIVIEATFIRFGEITRSNLPELHYRIDNGTSSVWKTLKLRFDIGGLCNGELRQWSLPIVTSIGWDKDFKAFKLGNEYINALAGTLEGCRAEIVKATLVLAEDLKSRRIVGDSDGPVDLSEELKIIKVKRDAEAAAKAEQERIAEAQEAERQRIADAEQAKKDALEATRQKKLAVERRKKQAEEDARYARYKAEKAATEAEDRAKIRAACAGIYKATSDKRMGDLTVKEDQQVKACQGLGLYLPR